MPVDWSRYVGLAIATMLLLYLIARCARPLVTGVFRFWHGIEMRREDNPKDFALCVSLQIAGTLIFLAVYAYVLYDKFAADFAWIRR
jgi:hypothetical protein